MRGHTLVEVLVVLAVIALLAVAAVPGYRGQVLRAGRGEARTSLLALATAQEKFYLECRSYAATLDASGPSDCATLRLRFPAATERGLYRITVDGADAAAWSATASRLPGTAQSDDAACRRLGLDSTGLRTARDDADRPSTRECWDR